jgi:hypothetical protein
MRTKSRASVTARCRAETSWSWWSGASRDRPWRQRGNALPGVAQGREQPAGFLQWRRVLLHRRIHDAAGDVGVELVELLGDGAAAREVERALQFGDDGQRARDGVTAGRDVAAADRVGGDTEEADGAVVQHHHQFQRRARGDFGRAVSVETFVRQHRGICDS